MILFCIKLLIQLSKRWIYIDNLLKQMTSKTHSKYNQAHDNMRYNASISQYPCQCYIPFTTLVLQNANNDSSWPGSGRPRMSWKIGGWKRIQLTKMRIQSWKYINNKEWSEYLVAYHSTNFTICCLLCQRIEST
jgi:hypothetical protein